MAITPCEALKKIREALGAQPVTPEALAQWLIELHMKFNPKWTPLRYADAADEKTTDLETWQALAADLLAADAAAEIRAILDAVNESLPEIYRK